MSRQIPPRVCRCDDGKSASGEHAARAIESAANRTAYEMVHDQNAIGDIRKIVMHDGHLGLEEIGYSEHFLTWLTDPVLN